MKKIIAVSAFLFLAFDGFSQAVGVGVGTGGFGMGMHIPLNKNSKKANHVENQVQQLKQELNLNNDQVNQVRGLLIERDRAHQNGDKTAMSNQDFDKRMQGILTPEQLPKYNQLKQEKREKRKEGKQETKKEPLPESQWDDVYQ